MDDALSRQVRNAAKQVRFLRPDYRNPERYFEERDEIEHLLRRIARRLEREHG